MATPQTLKRPEKSPAVKSLRKEQDKQRAQSPKDKEAELVRGLKDSFPASDPVSVTNTTTTGEPDKDAKAQ
jgi:hypothetical protein